MPLFPEYIISEVIEKNDIVDVISQTVALKRSGSSYMGLCPFHNEKTPSFSVSPQKGIFHCFGCGEGGTVISFVMKNENLTFVEAVMQLAARANIALPAANPQDAQRERRIADKKETLFAISLAAAKFFFSMLAKKEGAAGVAYLKERGLDGAWAKRFWLGYSPAGKRQLLDHLLGLGYSEGSILEAGLSIRTDTGDYIDKFRGRVMFPIFNVHDKIIGFGARRITEGSGPKYLNSPETLIYNKSKNLYGLNIARKSKSKEIILVEGYMDVISLMQAGIVNVAASLGTSLTADQAKLLKRYFHEVIICYDSDDAGIAAAKRAVGILREQDIKASVINVYGAKDTDEFIKKYGKDRFSHILSKRKTDILYLMQICGEKYNLNQSADKIAYITELLPYLASIKNEVELDVVIGELSQKTGVSTQAIYLQLNRSGRRAAAADSALPTIAPYAGAVTGDRLEKTQELLLSVLLGRPSFAKAYQAQLESLFDREIHKKLLKLMVDSAQPLTAAAVETAFLEEEAGEVTKILSIDAKCDDCEKAITDYIKTILDEKKKRKIAALIKAGDLNAINELQKDK